MGRDTVNESRAVRLQTARYGIPPLSVSDFGFEQFTGSGQTLFVLGSGSSVNELVDEDFQLIDQEFSIGVNHWTIHPYIPSAYSFEFVGQERHQGHVLDTHLRHLSFLEHKTLPHQAPLLIGLKPRSDFEFNQLRWVPESLRQQVRFYGRVTPRASSLSDLEKATSLLQILLRAPGMGPLVLDSGASVVRLTSLGLKLGFSRIVLVGVDHNNPTYFWEEKPEYLSPLGLSEWPRRKFQELHPTMIKENRPFGARDCLVALSKYAVGHNQTVYAGSSRSLLSQDLPVFSWPRNSNSN